MIAGMDVHGLLLPTQMAGVMAITAIAVLLFATFGPTAPYGRYSATGWGFLIPNRVAWFTQELPSFAVPAVWLALLATPAQLARLAVAPNALLMATFLLHYFHRDLIFPFRLRGGKPTPFAVWLLALVFCLHNGYMQTRYLLEEAPLDAAITPRFAAGLALWLAGWVINLHSDSTLIALRKPGDRKGRYRIPRGGMFEYVSAANYSGEILEWTGWALASWSLPATAFALFTFCNLAPRGWRYHQWYHRHFQRYPKRRSAVIPFLW